MRAVAIKHGSQSVREVPARYETMRFAVQSNVASPPWGLRRHVTARTSCAEQPIKRSVVKVPTDLTRAANGQVTGRASRLPRLSRHDRTGRTVDSIHQTTGPLSGSLLRTPIDSTHSTPRPDGGPRSKMLVLSSVVFIASISVAFK